MTRDDIREGWAMVEKTPQEAYDALTPDEKVKLDRAIDRVIRRLPGKDFLSRDDWRLITVALGQSMIEADLRGEP